MKRRIIISFILLLAIFIFGSSASLWNLYLTTKDMSNIIEMHEMEDLRYELSASVQKIQFYNLNSLDEITNHLDDLAAHSENIRQSVKACDACHHEDKVKLEITTTHRLVEKFNQHLQQTIANHTQHINIASEDRKILIHLNTAILNKVQEMTQTTAISLQKKTHRMLDQLNQVYRFFSITLIIVLLLALAISRYLIKKIIGPIDALLTATRKIASGKLGYATDYVGTGEFGELLKTFNEMSSALAVKEDRINKNLHRLDLLNQITLPLHSSWDIDIVMENMKCSIATLLDAEIDGFILSEDNSPVLQLKLYRGDDRSICILEQDIHKNDFTNFFQDSGEQAIIKNQATPKDWPFGKWPEGIELKNLLIFWLFMNGKLKGTIIAVNKKNEDFAKGDIKALSILANNIAIALENVGLYHDLQDRIQQLKKTQHHLVEAEKLTALSGLAGGVAHDFNNILTSILGYIALLKRLHTPDGKTFPLIESIETAGQRAAKLTKQLLSFARQEVSESQPVNINQSIKDVLTKSDFKIDPKIRLELNLVDNLPLVQANISQVEQMILNLIENAVDAMASGGILSISTSLVSVDNQKANKQIFPLMADYIQLTFSDTGTGIEKSVVSRIFEPFFTTKEFGKGTGLGLAMVYGIVKSHRGVCHVSSEPGKGTNFNIYLPVFEEKKPPVS